MNKKRVFGNGIVYCGVPLGGFILNPLWTYLFETYTWRSTCLIQAGISLNLLWISLMLIECPSCPVNTKKAPFSWSLLKSPAVILFGLAQLLFWTCYSSTTLLYPYLTEKGYSYSFAAEVALVQSISEVIFRPILSTALNKKSGLKFELMTFATIITAVSLGLTPLASTAKGLIAIAVAQGFSFAFVGGLPTCKRIPKEPLMTFLTRYHCGFGWIWTTSDRFHDLRIFNRLVFYGRAGSLHLSPGNSLLTGIPWRISYY